MILILKKLITTFRNLRFDRKLIRYAQLKYLDFPKYKLPSEVLMQITLKLPIFYFGVMFSQQEIGQLSLAIGILAVPMAFFGNTTSQAFYSHIANLGPEKVDEILEITISLVKKLFFASLIPGLLLMVFGSDIFSLIFGNEWEVAGIFASILAVYLIFQFVYSPIGNGVFNVFNKQKLNLQLNTFRIILVTLSFFGSYSFNLSSYNTLWVFSICISFFYCVSIFSVYKTLVARN